MSRLMLVTFALVVLAFGCGRHTTEKEIGPTDCAEGEADECTCASGSTGTRTCGSSGFFGSCICEDDPTNVVAGDAGPNNNVVDMGPSDAGNNVTRNNTTNNTTTNNTTNNTTTTNNGNPDMGMADATPADVGTPPGDPDSCDSANPPARCIEDPNSFTWQPASIVDDLTMAGTDQAPECCFDYTGDGQIDNSLGMNLAGFGFKSELNSALASSIQSGALVLVLEYDPLTSLTNGSFVVQWWLAEWAAGMSSMSPSGNDVLVQQASIDQGTQSLYVLPTGSLANGAVTTGEGTATIHVNLFAAPLDIPVRRARIEADVSAQNSGLPDPGVALTSGRLGGVIAVEDLYRSLNTVASTCSCLGISDPLIDLQTGMCDEDADAPACEAAGDLTCAEVADNCTLYSAVELFADVDLDADGVNDAVTVGMEFSTYGASIVGVAP